jgi:hypothetical protein
MTKWIWSAVALAAVAALPVAGNAQVVREDGVKSIAGVLYTQGPQSGGASQWSFKSAGGEILFASLDADIYRMAGSHSETAAAASEEEEGGPGLFKLRVLDAYGQTLCMATRTSPPPGWQRDPRMACLLPATGVVASYVVRVELANPKGELVQPAYPFLLNLSLRKIAPTGTNIQSAIAASGSGGL